MRPIAYRPLSRPDSEPVALGATGSLLVALHPPSGSPARPSSLLAGLPVGRVLTGKEPIMVLNEYDVQDVLVTAGTYRDSHPNLYRAAVTLTRLVTWANENSDGWPYWRKPSDASRKLQERLAQTLRERYRQTPTEIQPSELTALERPVKAFFTRQGVKWTEVL